MHLPHINWLAVIVSAVAIFILGGLWYSKALFAKKWIALMGISEEQMKAKPSAPMPVLLLQALVCSFLIAIAMAVIINHFPPYSAHHGAIAGAVCWLGFAAATSYATAVFSMQPKALWLINSGYNLVSFVMAGAILGAWR
jgi:hypothetical protein